MREWNFAPPGLGDNIMCEEYDVLVAGAGPAGIAAGTAAARRGARTLLVDRNPFPGGTWTAGGMCLVLDGSGKKGIMAEIHRRLAERGAWEGWPASKPEWGGLFAVEEMKRLLDEMLEEAGVEVRWHTFLHAARTEKGRLVSAATVSKSGIEERRAKVFVDATGDGDLSALAGCSFEVGRPGDGKMQPGTMFGLLGGWPEPLPQGVEVAAVLEAAGFELSYRGVTVFAQPGQPGLAFLMLSHIYGVDSASAASLTRAEIEGRRDVYRAVDCLKRSGDPRFANLFLISTGPFVTVREGRRIKGRYTLTAGDARAGRRFEDGICNVTFNFDVHHVDPAEEEPFKPYGTPVGKPVSDRLRLYAEHVPPYQIPYRCLTAAEVDNLLLSGRCISGDFLTHSSYRVTGNAVALGEVAGAAAALAAREGAPVAAVEAKEVALL